MGRDCHKEKSCAKGKTAEHILVLPLPQDFFLADGGYLEEI